MRRLLGIVLTLSFCLSGCRAPFSLPRAEEPRNMTIASVLGVENGERNTIQIFAATEGRNEKQPMRYDGKSDSLSGAFLDTRDQGGESVSYAHVEHIIIGAETVQSRLAQLLSFCFQNGEQSIESNLWILRDATVKSVFQGDMDLAKRLSTMKTSGEEGTSLPPRSLRETAAQLADDGSVIIPALRWHDGELICDSYALIQDGKLIGYLEGDLSRTMALLSEGSIYWTDQIKMESGREATVQLHSKGCRVRPVLQNGELCGLNITCRVDGKIMEVWDTGAESLHDEVEEQVKQELNNAIAKLQELNADGADLRRQAGISKPWNWGLIKSQWKDCFASLPYEITVKAKLTEHF